MKVVFTVTLLSGFLICNSVAEAQQIFIKQGKVEYEKNVNLYRFLGDNEPQSVQLKREGAPQFKTTYFDLEFTSEQTFYQPGKVSQSKSAFFFAEVATGNTVYNNLLRKETQARKFAFDKEFDVKDSLLKIQWRLTNEMRMIAGFNCRKAVGVFSDTLFIVAFFAEDILCSGGPEGITGLPGLILGLAFPRLHVTWFATKVVFAEVNTNTWKIPAQNKTINRRELIDKVLTTAATFSLPKSPILSQIIL